MSYVRPLTHSPSLKEDGPPPARSPGVSVEPALAVLLTKGPRALLQVVVRFVGTRVRPGPPSTLKERREEAGQANAANMAAAIAATRKATGQTPRGLNVFALTSAVYLEATPVFIKALLEQPGVVGAALNRQT